LANNEADLIHKTVKSAHAALMPGDALFVVADNCTDDTPAKAREAGAQVIIRNEMSNNSKGDALAWFVQKYVHDLRQYAMLTILDADSIIPVDFMHTIKSRISTNERAWQCFVNPLYEDSAPIGKLAALSELLDQCLSDKIRTMLGWPVRLRGTGMVIKTETLIEIAGQLDSKVEDIALSLILTARGVPIKRIEDAIVGDPKPGTAAAAARQRARWYRGQWQALWRYRQEVIKILLKGPAGWSLLSSMFLKPKWLLLTFSLLAALLLWRYAWLSLVLWAYLLSSLLYFLVGLSLLPERKSFTRDLPHVPAYIWMWLQGIALSLTKTNWFRARK